MPKISVIGGGLGGLATALALYRRGIDVAVYEKATELGEIGAGVVLSPNALKAMRYLGIEDRVIDIGVETREQSIRSFRSGRVIVKPRPGEDIKARYGATSLTIHRADLHDILVQAVPEKIVNLAKTCIGVDMRDGSAVAIFSDGTEVDADIVVGSDGIHSTVRDSLLGPIEPTFTGCICWRGLVPSSKLGNLQLARQFTIWWGPHGHIVHYPVRRGELVNFVAHFESDAWTGESWVEECPREQVMETYADWNPDLLELIGSSERYYKWALYDRPPLENWIKGRAALLGDAAHPMLPYLGQGACMAIEDGCVLAEAIYKTPDDLDTALSDYERVRKPRAIRAQLGSRFRAKENHIASPIGRFARDVKMAWRSRFGSDGSPTQAAEFYDYDVASSNILDSDNG
ncbi:MAG: 6-hydroxynicotinate 3-monooxygenase [Alphaproteobacteria bacterium MarineAlpha11_Bin1]|nr:MAG: 6-hydroxynicotinate 3-monooxygenase [Alphaproteobacteria bacterium MarineAlpha11_Bin1]|tara:strand:- start:5303 stop:6508 length:1206 start_codon:yes stop_codon:yes gene_type:complete